MLRNFVEFQASCGKRGFPDDCEARSINADLSSTDSDLATDHKVMHWTWLDLAVLVVLVLC
jgi:hypothetical protein